MNGDSQERSRFWAILNSDDMPVLYFETKQAAMDALAVTDEHASRDGYWINECAMQPSGSIMRYRAYWIATVCVRNGELLGDIRPEQRWGFSLGDPDEVTAGPFGASERVMAYAANALRCAQLCEGKAREIAQRQRATREVYLKAHNKNGK